MPSSLLFILTGCFTTLPVTPPGDLRSPADTPAATEVFAGWAYTGDCNGEHTLVLVPAAERGERTGESVQVTVKDAEERELTTFDAVIGQSAATDLAERGTSPYTVVVQTTDGTSWVDLEFPGPAFTPSSSDDEGIDLATAPAWTVCAAEVPLSGTVSDGATVTVRGSPESGLYGAFSVERGRVELQGVSIRAEPFADPLATVGSGGALVLHDLELYGEARETRGVLVDGGDLQATNVVFRDFDSDTGSAALAVQGTGNADLVDTTIRDNQALWALGGAVSVSDGRLTATGGTWSNNEGIGGGALFAGSGALVSLLDVALTDNTAIRGGAILVDGGELDAQASTPETDDTPVLAWSGNEARSGSGGAVLMKSGFLELTDLHLVDNATPSHGGAVALESGRLEVHRGTWSDNDALLDGGALHLQGGTASVEATHFAGNHASSDGGGIWTVGRVELDGVELIGNDARANGGGAYLGASGGDAPHAIVELTAEDNGAGGRGGGLHVTGPVHVSGAVELTGNHATSGGGAYWRNAPSFDVAQDHPTTIRASENHAVNDGGGLYLHPDAVTEQEFPPVLLRDNLATNGGGVHVAGMSSATRIDLPISLALLNTASALGGAIHFAGPGRLRIDEGPDLQDPAIVSPAVIAQNAASQGGGAVAITGGRATIDHDLQNNTSSSGPSTILHTSSSVLRLSGNLLTPSSNAAVGITDATVCADTLQATTGNAPTFRLQAGTLVLEGVDSFGENVLVEHLSLGSISCITCEFPAFTGATTFPTFVVGADPNLPPIAFELSGPDIQCSPNADGTALCSETAGPQPLACAIPTND